MVYCDFRGIVRHNVKLSLAKISENHRLKCLIAFIKWYKMIYLSGIPINCVIVEVVFNYFSTPYCWYRCV